MGVKILNLQELVYECATVWKNNSTPCPYNFVWIIICQCNEIFFFLFHLMLLKKLKFCTYSGSEPWISLYFSTKWHI